MVAVDWPSWLLAAIGAWIEGVGIVPPTEIETGLTEGFGVKVGVKAGVRLGVTHGLAVLLLFRLASTPT